MKVTIHQSWQERLQGEFDKPYFTQLTEFVRQEYAHYKVFPPGKLIFNAFNLCPFDRVKVVLIGQDPYHEPGQAHGLCFSVNDGVQFPPSLLNIFKEIQDDTGHAVPQSGNLTRWAEQGVLLLHHHRRRGPPADRTDPCGRSQDIGGEGNSPQLCGRDPGIHRRLRDISSGGREKRIKICLI